MLTPFADVTVMVVVPSAMAVASPFAAIVATDWSLLVHVNVVADVASMPFASLAVAENWRVPPRVAEAFSGEI